MTELSPPTRLVGSGVTGLDDILRGGWPGDRLYLVQGHPGSGKTTLGLQFLLEGCRTGEPVVYISLSETRDEIATVARSHGWSLDGIELIEITAAQQEMSLLEENSLFAPSEVELRELMQRIFADVERTKAQRVVFDSLAEMRLLAQNPLLFRRQILSLKQFFAGRRCTVLLLDAQSMPDQQDWQLQSLAHGVLAMETRTLEYGNDRRRLRMVKLRGVQPRGGYHEFAIERGGVRVLPRLVAAEHHTSAVRGSLPSGVPELDGLVGGGIDRGTATLLMGPSGSGKSTFALRYATSAADRGERVAIFAFDERVQTIRTRVQGLDLGLLRHLESGMVSVRQIDPAEMGPGEFIQVVREAVHAGARMVVVDSVNGYLNAMPEERVLAVQLHEMLSYLSQLGVSTFLVLSQLGLMGQSMTSPVDVSYLADNVILFRYFEAAGEVRKAVSVLKKRTGPHEHAIREYTIGAPGGVHIGPPLKDFVGVLTGVPRFVGAASDLMRKNASRGGDEPG
jgi:circadian clock protein KaiC